MSANVKNVYLEVISNVIENLQRINYDNSNNDIINSLQENWTKKILAHPAVVSNSNKKPCCVRRKNSDKTPSTVQSNDMEKTRVKITIAKKTIGHDNLKDVFIEIPKFVIQRNLVKEVLNESIFLQVMNLDREKTQQKIQQHVLETSRNLLKKINQK